MKPVQQHYKGNNNERIHPAPHPLFANQDVSIKFPLVTTSAAERLETESYSFFWPQKGVHSKSFKICQVLYHQWRCNTKTLHWSTKWHWCHLQQPSQMHSRTATKTVYQWMQCHKTDILHLQQDWSEWEITTHDATENNAVRENASWEHATWKKSTPNSAMQQHTTCMNAKWQLYASAGTVE